MARRATLRAADVDRERTADRLREAAMEGRLRTDELEERLGRAFAARTYGELDAVVADLPTPRALARPQPRGLALRPGAVLALVIGVPVALVLAASLVAVAVAAVVLHLLVGGIATWWVWALAAWFFLGRRRRRLAGSRYVRWSCGPRGRALRGGRGASHWA